MPGHLEPIGKGRFKISSSRPAKGPAIGIDIHGRVAAWRQATSNTAHRIQSGT